MTLETAATLGVELATESPGVLKVTGVQQTGARHRFHLPFFQRPLNCQWFGTASVGQMCQWDDTKTKGSWLALS